jgi:acetoin utilization protein AcuB
MLHDPSTHLTSTLKTLARTYTGTRLPVVSLDATLAQATAVMRERKVIHLPVILDDGTIVGLLAEKDLPRGERAPLDSSGIVRDYMSWPVESLDELKSISEAARLMLDKRISALLITRGETIQGLVTTDDLLRALIENEPPRSRTIELESAVYNSPIGSIAQVLADAGL